MSVTLSVAVMAHPAREAMVAELLEWLGWSDLPVVWDERNDRWDTGRRSMLAFDPAATHHVVIQDDVLPCGDLLEALPRIIERIPPTAPLCGYVGTVRPNLGYINEACDHATKRGASFVTMHTLNWGPLIAVPTAIIPEMVAYCDPLTSIENYDRRLSRYWELYRRHRIWYTWPCIVDHRDGPSMVPGRCGTHHRAGGPTRGSRVARRFLGTDVSAATWDWSGPVVDAGLHRRYSGPTVIYRHRRATHKELVVPAASARARTLEANPAWERVEA